MANPGPKPAPEHLQKKVISIRVSRTDLSELDRIGQRLGMKRASAAGFVLNLGVAHFDRLLKEVFKGRQYGYDPADFED